MRVITKFIASRTRRRALDALAALQRSDLLLEAGVPAPGLADRQALPAGWWLRFQATAG